jgi:hypothetical protein
VLKKASRKSVEVPDVPADSPVGTMDRFTKGLKRLLSLTEREAIKVRTDTSKGRRRLSRRIRRQGPA